MTCNTWNVSEIDNVEPREEQFSTGEFLQFPAQSPQYDICADTVRLINILFIWK